MALTDFASGLPVRSEADGMDAHVLTKICDGSSPAVNQATVDSDKNLHVEIHGDDPSAADHVVRTSELGAITPDGVYDAANNTKPGNVGVIASQRSATTGDTTQTNRVTSITDIGGTVTSMDVSMHDSAGEAISASNPLPVTMQNVHLGTEVKAYSESAVNLVRLATETHTYTVSAGKTLQLSQVLVGASGKIKAVVSINGAKLATMFNSAADANLDMTLKNYLSVAAGTTVTVDVTNLDWDAFGVYVTVLGEEV